MAENPPTLRGGWKYTAAGADMVAATGVGALIGYLLDRWWDTAPWMLVIWFILGSVAGFYSVYRRMQEGMKPPPSDKSK